MTTGLLPSACPRVAAARNQSARADVHRMTIAAVNQAGYNVALQAASMLVGATNGQ